MSAFSFHVVGSATCMRMSGAAGSTGCSAALTLQYSPIAVVPLPDGATRAASVTSPPVVGRPMARAGISTPSSAAQRAAASVAPAGVVHPREATTARATPVAIALALVRSMGLLSFDGGGRVRSRLGEATAGDVHAALQAERGLAPTTIATM